MPATTMPVAYAPEPLAYPNPPAANNPGNAAPMDIGARPALAAVSAFGAPSARAGGAQPDVVGQSLNNMLLGAPPAPLGQTRPSAPLIPPVGIGDGNEPIDPLTSGSIRGEQVAEATFAGGSPATSAPAVPAGSWLVQVGAAPSPADAKRLLARATSKVPTLNDARPYVERFDKDGRTFYRARFIGFGNERAATKMCGQLKRADMSCLAMQG
jgi:D-alanyl-D-alanine carboxypeptidase